MKLLLKIGARRCLLLAVWMVWPGFSGLAAPLFQTNDVIAFLGGANVVAGQESGQLETLLTLAHPDHRLRFRSLAWEGDTVFAQPRELNYPSLTNQLAQIGATVIFLQFGQTEALGGEAKRAAFSQAYDRLLSECSHQAARLVVVVPPPFEATGDPLLPDLTRHNEDLAAYAASIRALASKHGATVVDLVGPGGPGRLTRDGWHLTAGGQERVATAMARQLGVDTAKARNGPGFEQVRRVVAAKNRLWFQAARPTNWAFLGGDRTEQPSSHDHRDPKVRWFPAEMEQFGPLIATAESEIHDLALKANHSPLR
ncbi:MAG TPA: GDSL-type esterase/lipase family protein [Candidatus Limnocylindria bacterium]|nr:GDSL-type esterase/lipase family protein [Candidatus Limnocylindria bacterium]